MAGPAGFGRTSGGGGARVPAAGLRTQGARGAAGAAGGRGARPEARASPPPHAGASPGVRRPKRRSRPAAPQPRGPSVRAAASSAGNSSGGAAAGGAGTWEGGGRGPPGPTTGPQPRRGGRVKYEPPGLPSAPRLQGRRGTCGLRL